jgi:hypothetical protein
MSTATARRMTPFRLAVQAAVGSEPAAADMLAEMDRQRLAGMTVMAAASAETGQLAVSEEQCRDVIWAMTDGLLWHALVNGRGWSDEEYADWVGRLWVATLVRPQGRRS